MNMNKDDNPQRGNHIEQGMSRSSSPGPCPLFNKNESMEQNHAPLKSVISNTLRDNYRSILQ